MRRTIVVKVYNFIMDGKIIEVQAKTKVEAEELAKGIYKEIKGEQLQQQ